MQVMKWKRDQLVIDHPVIIGYELTVTLAAGEMNLWL
jgi:hypothetical protein